MFIKLIRIAAAASPVWLPKAGYLRFASSLLKQTHTSIFQLFSSTHFVLIQKCICKIFNRIHENRTTGEHKHNPGLAQRPWHATSYSVENRIQHFETSSPGPESKFCLVFQIRRTDSMKEKCARVLYDLVCENC